MYKTVGTRECKGAQSPLLSLAYQLTHGQSSYWTAMSSFLFLASDHTEADPNYTLGVDFWTMISYNLKNSG